MVKQLTRKYRAYPGTTKSVILSPIDQRRSTRSEGRARCRIAVVIGAAPVAAQEPHRGRSRTGSGQTGTVGRHT